MGEVFLCELWGGGGVYLCELWCVCTSVSCGGGGGVYLCELWCVYTALCCWLIKDSVHSLTGVLALQCD